MLSPFVPSVVLQSSPASQFEKDAKLKHGETKRNATQHNERNTKRMAARAVLLAAPDSGNGSGLPADLSREYRLREALPRVFQFAECLRTEPDRDDRRRLPRVSRAVQRVQHSADRDAAALRPRLLAGAARGRPHSLTLGKGKNGG